MKTTTFIIALASVLASTTVLANTQTVSPSVDSINLSTGEVIEFQLTYPEGNPETIGVGVTLYYDSSKLTFSGVSNTLSTSNFHQVQDPVADASDADGDPATDKKIVAAFANFSSEPFITREQMSADLFTASFTANENFTSGSTEINFSGDPAAGFSFNSPQSLIVTH